MHETWRKRRWRFWIAVKLRWFRLSVNNVFSVLILSSRWEGTFSFCTYYIFSASSICNNGGCDGLNNKVCFVDLVLLSGNRHILITQLPSPLTSEEGSTRAKLCVLAHSFSSPPLAPFFFSIFIHKMQQPHATIFTLASCCLATAAQRAGTVCSPILSLGWVLPLSALCTSTLFNCTLTCCNVKVMYTLVLIINHNPMVFLPGIGWCEQCIPSRYMWIWCKPVSCTSCLKYLALSKNYIDNKKT